MIQYFTWDTTHYSSATAVSLSLSLSFCVALLGIVRNLFWRKRYCYMLYYLKHDTSWYVHFIIVRNQEAHKCIVCSVSVHVLSWHTVAILYVCVFEFVHIHGWAKIPYVWTMPTGWCYSVNVEIWGGIISIMNGKIGFWHFSRFNFYDSHLWIKHLRLCLISTESHSRACDFNVGLTAQQWCYGVFTVVLVTTKKKRVGARICGKTLWSLILQ